ncbi:MAG: AAA family ATPase [Clostridiales Family XIII bacterium]|jgi:predicted ATPase|nr:AAA family ATPase [Clostridiales Family XIII bacterium]
MKIERIRLRNFKAFQSVEIDDMPDFGVIVGANGTGKSTFFDVFGFLKDCLLQNVTKAFQSRGGYKEVVSRNHEHEDIMIELQYRMELNGRDRLVTYRLEIGNERNHPFVRRESLRYKRGAYGSPFIFLNFENGSGYAINNEEDFDKTDEELTREPQTLKSADILAIKGLGQFERFKAANAFRQLIEDWYVSDFHIEAARGSKDITGYSEHLSPSGDNLQLIANELFENNREIFNLILGKMKRRVPGVKDISTETTLDGRLILKFGDGAFRDPFIDRYVSDGTIKMFAYLALLHDPNPHPLLCVEEPENQLYPRLMVELAEEFRLYANKGGQVFVSTHSPDFLNALQLDEVFWLSKRDGYTTVFRAKDDPQLAQFMSEGDQMGYLWKQGFFKDVDPE